jgi:hypothetical protein
VARKVTHYLSCRNYYKGGIVYIDLAQISSLNKALQEVIQVLRDNDSSGLIASQYDNLKDKQDTV